MPEPTPTYHIRVREGGVKKSIFVPAKNPKDARDAYKGKGVFLSCRKVGMERIFEIGEFFRFGDDLLRELNHSSNDPDVIAARQAHNKTEERVLKRRAYSVSRPEPTD